MKAATHRRAVTLVVLGLVGVGISIYLTWTKLSGTAPVCGPSGGCETVENSAYSAVAGIPVALFGIGYSAVVVALALRWGRTGDRRTGLALYALSLAGTLVEAYLVYLELFVIHAICLWCVGYGVTIVGGLAISVTIARAPDAVAVPPTRR